MKLAFAVALPAVRQKTAGGPGPVPLPGPAFDDFNAPMGSLDGRAVQGGAWAYTRLNASANNTALSVVTAGALSGGLGSGAQNVYALLVQPTSDSKWITRTSLAAAFNTAWTYHASFSGNAASKLTLSVTSGVLRYTPTVNDVAGSATSLINSAAGAGDTYQVRETVLGGQKLLDLYQNGRLLRNNPDNGGYNLASVGVPASGAHGFNGNMAPANTPLVDLMEVGDPETVAMVSLHQPNRIAQREADGSVVARLSRDFSLATSRSLTYSVIDEATGLAVSGHDNVPVANYAAAELAFSGRTGAFSSAQYHLEVRRGDIAEGGVAKSRGPIQVPGEVILITGQSLGTRMWNATTGATLAAPVGCYRIDASRGSDGTITNATDATRRHRPIQADVPNAWLCATIRAQAGMAGVPIAIIQGGRGGTTTQQRLPSTPDHAAEVDGVKHAGQNFRTAINIAGHFDTGAALRSTYLADTDAIFDDHEASTGTAIKVLEVPVGAIWGFSDADVEAMRRLQGYEMPRSRPGRYFPGPLMADQPHVDLYHLAGNSQYVEQARRCAWSWLKMMGLSSHDRSGPKLIAVAKTSASRLTVTLDLNGAGGLEIVNTAYAGDFRGGLRFATTSSFSSPLLPTAATIGAVAGTTQTVDFDFNGTPFASAPAFVSGPYGANPFNPANDSAINADMAGRASMLRGLFSGEPSIPIQPYWSETGDYVTAA